MSARDAGIPEYVFLWLNGGECLMTRSVHISNIATASQHFNVNFRLLRFPVLHWLRSAKGCHDAQPIQNIDPRTIAQ